MISKTPSTFLHPPFDIKRLLWEGIFGDLPPAQARPSQADWPLPSAGRAAHSFFILGRSEDIADAKSEDGWMADLKDIKLFDLDYKRRQRNVAIPILRFDVSLHLRSLRGEDRIIVSNTSHEYRV